MKRWDAGSVVLSRWWPLSAAAVVLVLQLYGWARAGRGVVAAARAAWPALWWIWPLLVAGLLIAWLHRPGVAATVAWLRRLPRAVAIGLLAAAALGLLVVVFVALPTWFVLDGAKVQDLYKARNDVRTTAVQATAGLVVLLGAYFTLAGTPASTPGSPAPTAVAKLLIGRSLPADGCRAFAQAAIGATVLTCGYRCRRGSVPPLFGPLRAARVSCGPIAVAWPSSPKPSGHRAARAGIHAAPQGGRRRAPHPSRRHDSGGIKGSPDGRRSAMAGHVGAGAGRGRGA